MARRSATPAIAPPAASGIDAADDLLRRLRVDPYSVPQTDPGWVGVRLILRSKDDPRFFATLKLMTDLAYGPAEEASDDDYDDD